MSNWNIPTYLLIVLQISVAYCLGLKQCCCIDVVCTIAERLVDSRETIIILAEIVDTFKGSNITKCFNLYSGHHQLYMNRQILEWQFIGIEKQEVGTNWNGW